MDIFSYFEQRAKEIDRGIHCHDRVEASFFNNRDDQRVNVLMAAANQARADRADPFTFNRTMSHMLNGTNFPSDYSVQFEQEERLTIFGQRTTVLSPRNWKRA